MSHNAHLFLLESPPQSGKIEFTLQLKIKDLSDLRVTVRTPPLFFSNYEIFNWNLHIIGVF